MPPLDVVIRSDGLSVNAPVLCILDATGATCLHHLDNFVQLCSSDRYLVSEKARLFRALQPRKDKNEER